MRLRYATRGSPLALAQSAWFAARLRELTGVEAEGVVVETSGDRFALAQPSAHPGTEAAEAPNVKAMFVKEIEEALLAGEVDFAVHSSKDLPGELPEGLVLACFPPREDPRDAFVAGPGCSAWAAAVGGTRVATSSLRRRIQLALARPGISFVPMRGNVDTRIQRMAQGAADALVLAMAGLKRLGRAPTALGGGTCAPYGAVGRAPTALGGGTCAPYGAVGRACVPHEPLAVRVVVPAPGQGALAVEARADRPDVLRVLGALDDPATRLAVGLERAFLRAMGGGCQTPLGAYARREGSALRLEAFWAAADGSKPVRRSASVAADSGRFADAAARLAGEMRAGS